MKNTTKKVFLAVSLFTGALVTPIVPTDMELVYSYQYDVEEASTIELKQTTTTPENTLSLDQFKDDDGNGVISISVFSDKKGEPVYTQIEDEKYQKMKERDGARENPSKTDFESVISLLTPKADAAIAFDNFAGSGIFNSSHNSITFSKTNTGSDLVMLVAVSNYVAATGNDRVSSMTYNGDALTKLSYVAVQANTPHSFWYILNPDTGTNNLTINYSVNFLYSWVAVASYTGVNQVSFPDAQGTDFTTGGSNTTSHSNSVTPVADNSWVVMGTYGEGGQSAGAGTTLRGVGLVRAAILDNNGPVSPAALTTLVQNQTSAPGASVIISMEPAAGGAPPRRIINIQ